MIFIRSDFHESDFVRYLNLCADLLEGLFDRLGEDLLSVLGGTDEMVEKKRDIVALVYVLAHVRILPVDVKPEGSAAELRGKVPLGFLMLCRYWLHIVIVNHDIVNFA